MTQGHDVTFCQHPHGERGEKRRKKGKEKKVKNGKGGEIKREQRRGKHRTEN